jgi:hypothetical protein
MKHWLIIVPAILCLSCGHSGDKSAAPGPGNNKGANRANTSRAPSSPEVSEKELLVPLYPGSKDDGSSVEDQGSRQTFISSRITTDSVQQVVDFYKPRLPAITQTVMAEHALLGGTFPKGKVTIAISKEDRGTTIGVSTTSDKQ